MKEKKNLIVLLPNFKFGGAGNSVFSLINYLKKTDFDISVICIGNCDYKNLFNKKINLYELEDGSLLFLFPKIVSIIKKIKNNYKKNIIYSNHHYANVYSIILKIILKNIHVIGVERTCIYELSKYFSFRDFFKKVFIKIAVSNIYKCADCIISNTIFTKKEILNFSKDNVVQIYSPSILKIKEYKNKKIDTRINLLWVGRLSKEKGCIDLINSAQYFDFKANIFILGDGNELNEIKKIIEKKRNNNVKFYLKKYVKKPDSYFKKSHILINTSFFEGSNNSIVQAINENLIILASDVPGGNKELLQNKKFGLFYQKNDLNDLTKKLKKMIKNYSKFQSKLKFKKAFLKNFTSNFSNKKTFRIINKL